MYFCLLLILKTDNWLSDNIGDNGIKIFYWSKSVHWRGLKSLKRSVENIQKMEYNFLCKTIDPVCVPYEPVQKDVGSFEKKWVTNMDNSS